MATETYEKIVKKVEEELEKLKMKDEEVKVRETKGKWRIIYDNGTTEINYEGYWTNVEYNMRYQEYTIEELIDLYKLIKTTINKIDKKIKKLDKIIDEL